MTERNNVQPDGNNLTKFKVFCVNILLRKVDLHSQNCLLEIMMIFFLQFLQLMNIFRNEKLNTSGKNI